MQTLRTPDDRFAGLPDFDFAPHYVEVDDGDGGRLRVHHLDEGPAGGEVVLLMHGEPSWSFLYRHMIPVLVAAGMRCVAPDLVGFGRSDKPTQRSDYSYARWDKPLLTAFSDGDPITKGGARPFQSLVPGARARQHVTIAGGGHFLQEDTGPDLARAVVDLVAATPQG